MTSISQISTNNSLKNGDEEAQKKFDSSQSHHDIDMDSKISTFNTIKDLLVKSKDYDEFLRNVLDESGDCPEGQYLELANLLKDKQQSFKNDIKDIVDVACQEKDEEIKKEKDSSNYWFLKSKDHQAKEEQLSKKLKTTQAFNTKRMKELKIKEKGYHLMFAEIRNLQSDTRGDYHANYYQCKKCGVIDCREYMDELADNTPWDDGELQEYYCNECMPKCGKCKSDLHIPSLCDFDNNYTRNNPGIFSWESQWWNPETLNYKHKEMEKRYKMCFDPFMIIGYKKKQSGDDFTVKDIKGLYCRDCVKKELENYKQYGAKTNDFQRNNIRKTYDEINTMCNLGERSKYRLEMMKQYVLKQK